VKKELTNIDIYVLSRELAGRRFSKIVRVPNGYKIKISGGKDIIIVPGKYVIPTSYVIEADRPDTISIIARKRLGNARISSIEQLNFDRIICIRTDRGSIILESFGEGNIIITDENNSIIYALHEREWRDRVIRRGVEYTPPPPPKLYPGIPFERFKEIFTAKDVVRSLVRSGLPPIYAEELCVYAGIHKNTPCSDLSDGEMCEIYSAFSRLIEKLNDPEPVAVYNGDMLVDILPVPLSLYSGYEMRRFSSFSEALDLLTPELFRISTQQQKKERRKNMVEYWKKQLEDAKQELSLLEKMIEKAYEHSYGLEKAINEAKSGNPPEKIGPFKLKKFEGKELVYDFTLPP